MKKSESVKSGLQAITVMFQYEDLGKQVERRYEGFLTSPNHAMFVEIDILMVAPVMPTSDPTVYLAGHTFELGIVQNDPSQNMLIIESVAKKLNSMTAYEFVTEIMMNVRNFVDFEDKIVPVYSKSDFLKATLKSGVA